MSGSDRPGSPCRPDDVPAAGADRNLGRARQLPAAHLPRRRDAGRRHRDAAAAAAGRRRDRRRGARRARRPDHHRRQGRRPGRATGRRRIPPTDEPRPRPRRLGVRAGRRRAAAGTCRCSASAAARRCSTSRWAARCTSICPTSSGTPAISRATRCSPRRRCTRAPEPGWPALIGEIRRAVLPPPGDRPAGRGPDDQRTGRRRRDRGGRNAGRRLSFWPCSGIPRRRWTTCGCSPAWSRRRGRTRQKE